MDSNIGNKIYQLATELFPICRSITGEGVRQTFDILKREIPELKTYEIASGTQCNDWTIPKEWSIKEAYVIDPDGKKIIDYKINNLHIVSYSAAFNGELSLEELSKH